MVRLQEVVAYEGQEEGRIPRTVDCELTEDLVDTCVPGDVVTVCGIVKVINTDQDMGGGAVGLFACFLLVVMLSQVAFSIWQGFLLMHGSGAF
jgi:DNA replicative helicase MCM subunit Mcm2 (Cdc46/Mcm family)